MRLRLLLPPLAVLFIGGVVWIRGHSKSVSPEAMLKSARARIEASSSDRTAATRELGEALLLAQGPDQAGLRAEILEERAELHANSGFLELALADCRTRLDELGPDADTLARASELAHALGEPGLALEYAQQLAPLDPGRGQSRIGRARVALADSPLAAIEGLARSTLPPSVAENVRALAQRAAVFADDENIAMAAREELLELFPRVDLRRQASEWVREAAEHLKAARVSFVASLMPGTTNEAIAGLQDLLLRAGAQRQAAELGEVALANPDCPSPMPVLARTASALVAMGRVVKARFLINDVRRRGGMELNPAELSSLPFRDELEEWCELLYSLENWAELRAAAIVLANRARNDREKSHLANFWAAIAALRMNQISQAQGTLSLIGTNPASVHDLPVRCFLLRAEIARRQSREPEERFALLLAIQAAPLDPAPPLRAELGKAWQRLAVLQEKDGESLAALVSLTHALRCSDNAAEVLPLWEKAGEKTRNTRGFQNPYLFFLRARFSNEQGQAMSAMADARQLLSDFPGLGPALEIVASAAGKLGDYPQMIESSLELLERGWPGGGPSSLLRKVPNEYFLPQDRVRWLLLDPRGPLEPIVQRLMAKGDVMAASRAARGGPAKFQPDSVLPYLARVELEAGEADSAHDTLQLLKADSALFQANTALALRAALLGGDPEALASTLERVLSSGPPRDEGLLSAVDLLLAHGRLAEVQALSSWMEKQPPRFLSEWLLRPPVVRLLGGEAEPLDEDLERVAALLDDGRPELGRLVLAHELDDREALAREALAALATPFASTDARRAALFTLAGEHDEAQQLLRDGIFDGRDLLLEWVAACLGERLEEREAMPPGPRFSALLGRDHEPEDLLVLALASESAPWTSWALARTAEMSEGSRQDPWIRTLRARCWLALSQPEPARAELEAITARGRTDSRVAWMRVQLELLAGESGELLDAQLDWLQSREQPPEENAQLARLGAVRWLREGQIERARTTLEEALAKWPNEVGLLRLLAEQEDTPGRRTRAIELYTRALAHPSGAVADATVMAFLDVLRKARDDGEITEPRWWAEVEALESVNPQDPAPTRELAERLFSRGDTGQESGRSVALQRLSRLRARTLGRSLEALRTGEAQRWTRLLATYTPERAVSFAEEELLLDPSDPALWRASVDALIAAGRVQEALRRLEALEHVAPDIETARMLALISFQTESDRIKIAERLASFERYDEGDATDPLLSFYRAIGSAVGPSRLDEVDEAMKLWEARETNGLNELEHGRALAICLFQNDLRSEALRVLRETMLLTHDALAKDVVSALGDLIDSMPEPTLEEPEEKDPSQPEELGADDGPGKPKRRRGAAGGGPKRANKSGAED